MPNNDFILPVSFNKAQEIGLEESVLLAFFEQHAFILCDRNLNFDIGSLSTQLSFWTRPVLLRILANLQLCQSLNFERNGNILSVYLPQHNDITDSAQPVKQNRNNDVLSDKSPSEDLLIDKVSRLQQQAYTQKTISNNSLNGDKVERHSSLSHDLSEKGSSRKAPIINNDATLSQYSNTLSSERQSSTHSWSSKSPRKNEAWPQAVESNNDSRRGVTDFDLYLEQKERTRQPDQWQPEEATLEQIAQAGIDRPFALQLQSEFLLRIKEQRKNVRTWNSEFFKYVKRQWQYKQSDKSSHEGTQGSSYNSRTSKEQVSDALTNIHDTDW